MTHDDSSAQRASAPSGTPGSSPSPDYEPSELEVRLAQLEATVFAHAERIAEFDAAARQRQRRALWLRLVVLVLALVAFFALKTWGPGSGS